MGGTAILEAIEREAAAEAAALLVAARQRAATMVADARAHADAEVRGARAEHEPALQREASRLVNAARLRRVRDRTEADVAVVDRAFALAAERLTTLADDPSGDRWRWALVRLVEEAVAFTGPGSTVRVRPADAAALQDGHVRFDRTAVRLEVEADAAQGFVCRSADGRLEVDGTLPTRLRRARAALASEVARLLGPEVNEKRGPDAASTSWHGAPVACEGRVGR